MNRRFCAALLFLLICGGMGVIPMLRAEPDETASDNQIPGTGDTSQNDQRVDPPLPPLPDAENPPEDNAAGSATLPWATKATSANSAPAEAKDETTKESVLLHRNGRLFRGEVVDQGDRYIVKLAYGEVELRKSEVEFVGDDVMAVYRFRQSRVEPGSIDPHLDLASWCAAEKLLTEAEQELAVAASLAPSHPKIPLIARQIELARREPEADADAKATTAVGPAVAASYARYEQMARNLPAGAVETFTEQVQPLLMNSCATSGCHVQGSTQSVYQIQRFSPSQGATKRLTQRNLQASLRYIDPKAMEKSELLTRAAAEHGGSRTPPIGSTDSAQFETLAKWVVQVVGPQAPVSTTPAQPAGQNANQINGAPNPAAQLQQLSPQQPVVRTSDEIRAMLSGHSFVEKYDLAHPKTEMVQYGVMGERPASEIPGFQGGLNSTAGTAADAQLGQGSDQQIEKPSADSLADRAQANGVTLEEQALIDEVSTIEVEVNDAEIVELPPNHVRIGAGDQQLDSELHEADLQAFEAKDPFDPEIFNRRFGTRPAMTAGTASPRPPFPMAGEQRPPQQRESNPPAANAISNNQPPRGGFPPRQ